MGLDAGMNLYAYAEGNPLGKADPLGLATYLCKRRLRNFPFEVGPLFHEYVCTGSAADGYFCGGLLPVEGDPFRWLYGESKIESDVYRAGGCKEKHSDNKCIEQCIAKRMSGPLPMYSLDLSRGENCQAFASGVVIACETLCQKR